MLFRSARRARDSGLNEVASWAYDQLGAGASTLAERRQFDQRIVDAALAAGDTVGALEAQMRVAESFSMGSVDRRRAMAQVIRLETVRSDPSDLRSMLQDFVEAFPKAIKIPDIEAFRLGKGSEPKALRRILAMMSKMFQLKLIFPMTDINMLVKSGSDILIRWVCEAEVIPTPEDAPFPIQTSLYASSKLAGESLISSYCEGFDFQAWIFRFVSILGERYTHGHVFDFYKKLKRDPTRLEVLGNGKQRKSYLYVQDCIDSILLAIEKGQKKVNLFNLGVDGYCTVNDSIGWICEALGVDPKLNYSGGERGWIGDNPFIYLDTQKINQLG